MIRSPLLSKHFPLVGGVVAALAGVGATHAAPPVPAAKKAAPVPAARWPDNLPNVALLAGTVCFTIPWGERPGQLTFAPAERYRKGDDFTGPSGLAVDNAGMVYVQDRYKDRVSLYDSHGRLQAMMKIPRPTTGDFFAVSGYNPQSSYLWLGDMFGNLMYLSPKTLTNALVSVKSAIPTAETPTTSVFTMADWKEVLVKRIAPYESNARYVEVQATGDDNSYVQYFIGDRYQRHVDAIDLVGTWDYAYALALDRTGQHIYRDAQGKTIVVELGPEGDTLRELPLALPARPAASAPDRNPDRWHLVGAARGTGKDPVFYFATTDATSGHARPGDTLYLVTPRRGLIGRVAVHVPQGFTSDRWLRHFNHLMTVTRSGDLYLGIPTKAGLTIVRYAQPGTGDLPQKAKANTITR